MEKSLIEIKEIFNQIGSLELEEKKIQNQIKKLKDKYGIKKSSDRLYVFEDFSKIVQMTHKGHKLDISKIEALFTDVLSEPQNILIAIKYISNTWDSDLHPFRVSAFYNIIEFPDIAEEIMGKFSLRELKLIINRHQEYWFNKYDSNVIKLFTIFINGLKFLTEENQMKLIIMLGDRHKITELKRAKMSGDIEGECLEKLDSYLVLETLKKGSL